MKEYRVTYLSDHGPIYKLTVQGFNILHASNVFYTHFPLHTNVTAIQEIVRVKNTGAL